jgi:hypothetical protein
VLAGERAMLSDDMTRFVDLHRGLGFKFHTQHGLLRSFVAFAEAHGDEFVRRDRVLDWASQAPSPPLAPQPTCHDKALRSCAMR